MDIQIVSDLKYLYRKTCPYVKRLVMSLLNGEASSDQFLLAHPSNSPQKPNVLKSLHQDSRYLQVNQRLILGYNRIIPMPWPTILPRHSFSLALILPRIKFSKRNSVPPIEKETGGGLESQGTGVNYISRFLCQAEYRITGIKSSSNLFSWPGSWNMSVEYGDIFKGAPDQWYAKGKDA
jgi:hypothetical protein